MQLGMLRIRVISADPINLLCEFAKHNLPVMDVEMNDGLMFCFTINGKYYTRAAEIAEKSNAELFVIQNLNLYSILRRKLKRPIMILGVCVWVFLLYLLPARVLFIEVQGNETVSKQLILEKAEESGVTFGSARGELRSEKIKNALLSKIPQLEWAGVNTQGCLAIITVRERVSPESEERLPLIGNVIAACDGVISRVVTTKGTSLCRPGQAVTKGQVLVSGYTDGGFALRAETAEAEVFAITERKIQAYSLQDCTARGEILNIKTEYSIQIGKNVVELLHRDRLNNFDRVKTYETKVLTLPGGFTLPVALIKEKYIQYENSVETVALRPSATELAELYLHRQMLSGCVLKSNYSAKIKNERCELNAVYICEEAIGLLRKEEIVG